MRYRIERGQRGDLREPLEKMRYKAITSKSNTSPGELGSLGKQESSNVSITGGSITGITDLLVADGGTGVSTLLDHGVLVGSGTDPVTVLAVGTNGQVLIGSTGADPVFGTITDGDGITATLGAGTLGIEVDLKADGGLVIESGEIALDLGASSITGTLAVADGGTGVTTATGSGSVVLNTSPTLVTPALGTPVSGDLSNCGGSPTFDTVTATLADIGTIHAIYSDSTTQTITSTTVPWVMTHDTEEISDTHITHGKSGEVTISISSPAVINWTGHGLNVDSEVVFTTDGALPTGLTAGTRYYVISAGFGADSFQVSATPQGAAINTSGTQSGTHTATNISIFTIGTSGTYGFIFSTLCDCTSGNGTTVDIWFRKNGVDVDRSNTRVQIATQSNVVISIADIILDLIVGDEIEMFWVGSSTDDRLLAVAAQVSPTRPATPSTILTIKKVSK